MVLPQWLDKADTAVKVALIAAVASLATSALTILHSLGGAPFKYWIEKKALRNRLATEYEYEQRKSLRTLIGRYQGQLVESGESLNHRMWNLYQNEAKGWLRQDGKYEEVPYYFQSWAYRFMNFFAVVRFFEREATYIDARVAEQTDLDFVKFIKAFNWAACDVALFEGIDYDAFHQTDHLFRDNLRRICDACCKEGAFLDHDKIHAVLREKANLSIYRFLDDLKSNEDRLRWDRLLVIDLLIMAFLNTFGYAVQRSTQNDFRTVVQKIRHPKILDNLQRWLSKLGLAEHAGAGLILKAMD